MTANILVKQVGYSDRVSSGQGDSGGPVFALRGDKYYAVGTVVSGPSNTVVGCGPTAFDLGSICTSRTNLLPIRKSLALFGAKLDIDGP